MSLFPLCENHFIFTFRMLRSGWEINECCVELPQRVKDDLCDLLEGSTFIVTLSDLFQMLEHGDIQWHYRDTTLSWFCKKIMRDNSAWIRSFVIEQEFGFDILQDPDNFAQETLNKCVRYYVVSR